MSVARRALGPLPALVQDARRAVHRPRRHALCLVLRGGRDRRRAARAARRGDRPARRAARAARLRPRSARRAALACWLAAAKLSSKHGGPIGALSHIWHQFSGGGAVGSTDHLSSLSTNLRSRWWGEAWDALPPPPAAGNGADTFETIDRLARPDFQQAGQEHSSRFHVLSGLGLLGAIPAGRRWSARPARARPRSRACAAASARRPSRSSRAPGRSPCTTRSTGSGSRPR